MANSALKARAKADRSTKTPAIGDFSDEARHQEGIGEVVEDAAQAALADIAGNAAQGPEQAIQGGA